MKITLLTVFLMLMLLNVRAQNSRREIGFDIKLLDSTTRENMKGATVTLGSRTLISDDNGNIRIPDNIVAGVDSLKISYVGYQTKVLPLALFQQSQKTILLSKTPMELREIRILPRDFKAIALGEMDGKYTGHLRGLSNDEYVKYIPNDKKIKGTIISLEYIVNDALKGIDKPFGVMAYSVAKDTILPDSELLPAPIIVYNPKKRRRLSVDISKYNIPLPEQGFFVSFQLLPGSYYPGDTIWDQGTAKARMPGIDFNRPINGSCNDCFEKQKEAIEWHRSPWFHFAIGAVIVPDQ